MIPESNDDLRLDRAAGKFALDLRLDLLDRTTDHGNVPREGNCDRTSTPDRLSWQGHKVPRPKTAVAGSEQSARGRFKNGDRQNVADTDPKRRRATAKGAKAIEKGTRIDRRNQIEDVVRQIDKDVVVGHAVPIGDKTGRGIPLDAEPLRAVRGQIRAPGKRTCHQGRRHYSLDHLRGGSTRQMHR
jgi:hypothetical protein